MRLIHSSYDDGDDTHRGTMGDGARRLVAMLTARQSHALQQPVGEGRREIGVRVDGVDFGRLLAELELDAAGRCRVLLGDATCRELSELLGYESSFATCVGARVDAKGVVVVHLQRPGAPGRGFRLEPRELSSDVLPAGGATGRRPRAVRPLADVLFRARSTSLAAAELPEVAAAEDGIVVLEAEPEPRRMTTSPPPLPHRLRFKTRRVLSPSRGELDARYQ